MIISGNLIDVHNRSIYGVDLEFIDGIIVSISKSLNQYSTFISPGLIDSHVHIESSMLTPQRFSELIVPRGTIAVVADPHEIANVCGIEGVEFMIADSKLAQFKAFFCAPSCVPATPFETSGFSLGVSDVQGLMQRKEIVGLAEMMNFPGVLSGDAEIALKLHSAIEVNKPIDGHAPRLSGDALSTYIASGVRTDHECSSLEEALEKISKGMMVQIREGSAAKDFNVLASLIASHPDKIMFCTDDCHPDEIVKYGHIDEIVKRALALGYDIFDILKASSINPIQFYSLPVGQLRVGDRADFIVVDDLKNYNIIESYIDGKKVFGSGTFVLEQNKCDVINNFSANKISSNDLLLESIDNKRIRVINAMDGELLTTEVLYYPKIENGFIVPDVENDLLKLVVINRYKNSKPQVGFIKGFQLKEGAIGGSVAHDSHNLIFVGTNDMDIVNLANAIIEVKGGIGSCINAAIDILQLPIAGLMSSCSGAEVASDYERLNKTVKLMGTQLSAPFMTLAFMSLLVIPHLKLGDKGLFDSTNFKFVDLFED